jgi:CheY-like chemotaxis protein
MAIAELLGKDDIDVVSVGTGAEALDQMRREPVDCVVLDLRLPDMFGQQFLEQVREDPLLAEVPVVVFTGRDLFQRGERDAAQPGAQRRRQGRRFSPAAAR